MTPSLCSSNIGAAVFFLTLVCSPVHAAVAAVVTTSAASVNSEAGKAAAPQIVLAPALTKVLPETAFLDGTTELELTMARREYESWQIVVNGAAQVQKVEVVVESSDHHDAIASQHKDETTAARECAVELRQNIAMHEVRYIDIRLASDCDGHPGRWPDALVPFRDSWHHEQRAKFPIDVPAGENRALWFDIFAPKNCRAGHYRISVTSVIADDKGKSQVVALHLPLTLFDFELPPTSLHYRTTYGLTPTGILQGLYQQSWLTYKEELSELLEKYLDLGLQNRVSFTHGSGGPLADPLLDVNPVDWEAFWRKWRRFLAKGSDSRLSSVEVPLKHFNESHPGGGTEFRHFISGLSSAAERQGWSDLLYSKPCDEPHKKEVFDDCRKRAEALLAGWSIGSRPPTIMVTTDLPTAQAFNATDFIEAYCPLLNFMECSREHCSDYPAYSFHNNRPDYAASGADRNGLWWYQSCMSEGCSPGINKSDGCDTQHLPCRSGWPSYMIDAPAIMNRAFAWLSYLYNVSGELYWSANFGDGCNRDSPRCATWLREEGEGVWGIDTWTNQLIQGGNGDGQLTYPGRTSMIGGEHSIPIASLRLKTIRDSLEDLEYFYLYESVAGREQAAKFAQRLATNTFNFTRNIKEVGAVRAELGQLLEERLRSSRKHAVVGNAAEEATRMESRVKQMEKTKELETLEV